MPTGSTVSPGLTIEFKIETSVNSKFMPVGVHSIVLWVHADMNEWFMTCSVYGGSRAQYFRTHRGETFARVASVVWWKGFIWPWFRLFSRFIFVGDNTINFQFCGQKFIWDFHLPRGRGLQFQVATSVAGGLLTQSYIYIYVYIINTYIIIIYCFFYIVHYI